MNDTNHIELLHQVTCIAREYRDGILDDTLMVREMTAALSARASAGEGGVGWPNGSDKTVPAALRYLAEHERPIGGEQRYNSAHLYQLADEVERMASRLLTAAPQPAQAGASGGGDVAELVAAAEGLLEEDSVWDDDLEEEVSESAKACNKHVRAYQRLKSAVARFTTPASSATGQVAAGCAHVWVPGQAGMMYCDQCGRQKPAATPQPAAAQGGHAEKVLDEYVRICISEHDERSTKEDRIDAMRRAMLAAAPQPQELEVPSPLGDWHEPAIATPAHGDGEGDKSEMADSDRLNSGKPVSPREIDKNQAHDLALSPTPEAHADTKRLDFLLDNCAVVKTSDGHHWRVEYEWLPEGTEGPFAATKRAAIDAALALPAQGEG